MRVAVIGAGNVGKAVGGALATKGHDVVHGVRDLKKPDAKPAEKVEKALDEFIDCHLQLALPSNRSSCMASVRHDRSLSGNSENRRV